MPNTHGHIFPLSTQQLHLQPILHSSNFLTQKCLSFIMHYCTRSAPHRSYPSPCWYEQLQEGSLPSLWTSAGLLSNPCMTQMKYPHKKLMCLGTLHDYIKSVLSFWQQPQPPSPSEANYNYIELTIKIMVICWAHKLWPTIDDLWFHAEKRIVKLLSTRLPFPLIHSTVPRATLDWIKHSLSLAFLFIMVQYHYHHIEWVKEPTYALMVNAIDLILGT